MSYDVGTHIDLTWINGKSKPVSRTQKKSSFPPESIRRLYAVGTQFIFDQTTGKLALKIPVNSIASA